jgi:Peptidase A4 family
VVVLLGSQRRLLRRICCAAALVAAPTFVPAVARASEQVSSNWGGYVAARRPEHGKFTSVSGTWVVPTATCSAGREAYSAVWVGLGGYNEHAKGLEQLGTEQDCNRKGTASYTAWFEILPASSRAIKLNVHAGDSLSASTTVTGRSVTFRIRDLTTGGRYAATRRASATDVSTAEWIVEAPSACAKSGGCTALPLANVGTVQFASATAAAGKQTGIAGDAVWSNTTLKLEQESLTLPGRPFHAGAEAQTGPTRTLVTAAPSAAAAPYGSFSVSLTEQITQLPAPSIPTLPGFGRP